MDLDSLTSSLSGGRKKEPVSALGDSDNIVRLMARATHKANIPITPSVGQSEPCNRSIVGSRGDPLNSLNLLILRGNPVL